MISIREVLTQKMQEAKAMQEQLRQLKEKINLLDTTKNLSKNVIDQEGFPRVDLNFGDLVQYKNLKRRFNELNNDHIKIMKQVEKELFNLHHEMASDPTIQQEANVYAKNKVQLPTTIQQKYQQKPIAIEKQKQYKIQYLTPFAKISSVQQGSPAEKAGIKANDLISQIGSITIYEPDSIKSIPRVIKQGVSLKIVVMRLASQQHQSKVFNVRGEQRIRVDLELIPKKWDGRGLVGCKIDPL